MKTPTQPRAAWLRTIGVVMRVSVLAWGLSLCLIGLATAADVAASVRKETHIPAEALGAALQTLAKDRNFQIVYVTEELADVRTEGAAGEFTAEEALKTLLKGTGFTYRYLDEKTVTVSRITAGVADTHGSNPAPSGVAPHDGDESSRKEAGKNSSQDFRVAQVDQTSPGPQTVGEENEKKPIQLEEVIVTGSRLKQTSAQGARQVKVYTREKIEQSGQTTIAGFLNGLPDASAAVTEGAAQTFLGGTTVRLHGLPLGTTLVLINGRRVETTGAQGFATSFFDLNSVPLAAVERIEVVSEGSSAIYGSDAIAGVVNILLKKDFDGLEANARYGSASDTHDSTASIAWGKRWNKGSLSLIGSYQTRSELEGFDRPLTGNQDYRRFGGPDSRSTTCSPANIYSVDGNPLPGAPPGSNATFAAVSPDAAGNPRQTGFMGTYGTLNRCSLDGYDSYLPATHRAGMFAYGAYNPVPSVQLFAELMYSDVHNLPEQFPPALFAVPGFAEFVVPASNPYNPFGVPVGVGGLFGGLGRVGAPIDTVFIRPLAGVRGTLRGGWEWEVAAWGSRDLSDLAPTNQLDFAATVTALNSTDPATALNPFVAGAWGSAQLLRTVANEQLIKFSGETKAASAFVRGPLFRLPSGPVEVVLGGEYDHDKLHDDYVNTPFFPPDTQTTFTRSSHAIFGEARIPLVANRTNAQAGERLALMLADRYDSYSDFGSKNTPQFGAEWRPLDSLLLRGTYGEAFRAPSLNQLYEPVSSFQQFVTDPLRNNEVVLVNSTFGGNPDLRPETGKSQTLGLVYSSRAIPNLQLAVTHWKVKEEGNIQALEPQVIVSNESAFPGYVVRAPGQNGQPGPIISVNGALLNYGTINLSGLSYQADYRYHAPFGELLPSLSVTQTYRYSAALQPGAPPTDRTSKAFDDSNFAPRWKGTAALGWKLRILTVNIAGRYVGRYQDYERTVDIGNFWLVDASCHFALGDTLGAGNPWLSGAHLDVGAINLFDKQPQFSNYFFGLVGYDPTQADLVGRVLYVQAGLKW